MGKNNKLITSLNEIARRNRAANINKASSICGITEKLQTRLTQNFQTVSYYFGGNTMKLYRYRFRIDKVKVEFEELEVEEKAKTYTILNADWQKSVHKEDIGKVSGYSNNIVILLEKDFEKARTLYLAHLQKIIIEKKESLANMKKYYKDICDLEAI